MDSDPNTKNKEKGENTNWLPLIFISMVLTIYTGVNFAKYLINIVARADIFYYQQVIIAIAFLSFLSYAFIKTKMKSNILQRMFFFTTMTLLVMSYTILDLSNFSERQTFIVMLELAAYLLIQFIYDKWRDKKTSNLNAA